MYSETWITRTAGDHRKVGVMKSLSYELCSPFALTRVMSYALPLLQPELCSVGERMYLTAQEGGQ